jgi:hypothetical protein
MGMKLFLSKVAYVRFVEVWKGLSDKIVKWRISRVAMWCSTRGKLNEDNEKKKKKAGS